MKAFPKRQYFLASSYLIALYNERPVKFLYKLFAKYFTEEKTRLQPFGIRCGRRVQKTHLGRSSISSLELLHVCHSPAMLFQVVVLLVSEGPFEQNPFI